MKCLLIFALLGLAGATTLMHARVENGRLPGKVLVGTCVFPHYGDFPGLEVRLAEIEHLLDAMGKEQEAKYAGKSLDLMLLPEHAVTGGKRSGTKSLAKDKAMVWEGAIAAFLGEQARKHESYIAVPMHEAREGKFYNSVILVDREGKRVGFQYQEREDGGLFWSNDPSMSIDEMAEMLGFLEHADRCKRSAELNPHW